MAQEYDNTNRGAIFKNERKTTDSQPDFTGSLNVDGVEFWVSAWKRKPGASEKYPALSFSVQMKEDKPINTVGNKQKLNNDDLDDDIPY